MSSLLLGYCCFQALMVDKARDACIYICMYTYIYNYIYPSIYLSTPTPHLLTSMSSLILPIQNTGFILVFSFVLTFSNNESLGNHYPQYIDILIQ